MVHRGRGHPDSDNSPHTMADRSNIETRQRRRSREEPRARHRQRSPWRERRGRGGQISVVVCYLSDRALPLAVFQKGDRVSAEEIRHSGAAAIVNSLPVES